MLNPKIQVERLSVYSIEDARALGQLSTYLYHDDPGTPIEKVFIEEIIKSPRSDILVTRHKGQIVGKGTVNLMTTELYRKVHLDNFATHINVRGQGYGAAILDEVTVWAKEVDATKISLVSDQIDAINMYERRGFVERPDRYFNLFLKD
jgi:GNAT superfamily N-acetyltransferase